MRPTAVVTGAGRGIGRAIAHQLARDAWVAATDLSFQGPEVGHVSIPMDVCDRRAVKSAITDIVEDRGGIDWLVCSAGTVRDRVSWKMEDKDWDDVISVNLTGAFNVVREVIPHLRQSSNGRLILIGSINGVRGKFGQSNYAASKAGLIGLAKSLALELARDRVTVNLIAPGFIETPMTAALPREAHLRAVARTPLGRAGTPDDVATAVRFLCGDDAGFITGAVVPVDGGQLLGGVVQ
jgi:3-oxoacyl-[acyl-carrier protein] reductase